MAPADQCANGSGADLPAARPTEARRAESAAIVSDSIAVERPRPSAFRTARTRTPRCRCACRRLFPAPAPGSCTRQCRESRRLRHRGQVIVGDAQTRVTGRPRRLERFRQTEVQHLHGAIGAQLDVGGLQVAMNDAALVGGFEGVGDLPRDRSASSRGIGPSAIRSASVGPSTSSRTSAGTPSISSSP